MVVAQHLAADPLHHRPVPLDQRREGGFVSMVREPFKQLPVAEPNNRASVEKHPQVAICRGLMSIGHASGSLSASIFHHSVTSGADCSVFSRILKDVGGENQNFLVSVQQSSQMTFL